MSGKSAVVNRFSKWLDMRNVRAVSYWHESDDERMRPGDWRFWRDLPGKGEISILFGSWYTRPILKATLWHKKSKPIDTYLKQACDHINQFEILLSNDGIIFIKLWFHLSKKEQKARIKDKKKSDYHITPYEKKLSKSYDDFSNVSHRVLQQTDNDVARWHIINSSDRRRRDLEAGRILLDSMHRALELTNKSTK